MSDEIMVIKNNEISLDATDLDIKKLFLMP